MIPPLAHQGGWDEMLVAAVLVMAVIGVVRLRRRWQGRANADPAPPRPAQEDACAYCGAPLPNGADRCPSCGFRTARGAGS